MIERLGAVCDDFCVNSRLFLKMDLGLQRETVLHFFDRIRKAYPTMSKFRRRDERCLVLEEEPNEDGRRRWIRLDGDSLRFGVFSPSSVEEVQSFTDLVLTHAPYYLTFSDIDFEHLELTYGFDLEYKGNHDHLVAETFWSDQLSGGFLTGDDDLNIIDAQPYLGIALTPECDLQAYVEVKSRTTTYEVRSDNYDGEPITVFLTMRKYWGVTEPVTLTDASKLLFENADRLAVDKVVPLFVNPLAAAIANRS